MEHNIRHYLDPDSREQARLVSPAKDPTLCISDSIGNVLQCAAGFVITWKRKMDVAFKNSARRKRRSKVPYV